MYKYYWKFSVAAMGRRFTIGTCLHYFNGKVVKIGEVEQKILVYRIASYDKYGRHVVIIDEALLLLSLSFFSIELELSGVSLSY